MYKFVLLFLMHFPPQINKSLDHFDLSHNEIGEHGIKHIAAALGRLLLFF